MKPYRKITKSPKKIILQIIRKTVTQTVYTCPSCNTEFYGCVGTNVLKFKCSCGQVLIIDSTIET
jgi:predicted RNA-binding Zn-ribbon protein involved in translation (DUF1610 family)